MTNFTRRSFLQSAAVSGLALVLDPQLSANNNPAASNNSFNQWVDVFIGTGGHGHTYPGATVPFGMVQLSPDTGTVGWDHCSGYHINDTSIMGFSHTHLTGTGIGDMLDVLAMPAIGSIRIEPGSPDQAGAGYRSRFLHDDEHAEPGYYSVFLKDCGIKAELTSSARV